MVYISTSLSFMAEPWNLFGPLQCGFRYQWPLIKIFCPRYKFSEYLRSVYFVIRERNQSNMRYNKYLFHVIEKVVSVGFEVINKFHLFFPS